MWGLTVRCSVLVGLAILPWAVIKCDGGERNRVLEYAPSPVDNPLKGLVPYQADVRRFFPHSMEFNYLPYSALVRGYDEFDWQQLEAMLDDIAGRGHQAVLRIFLEYPGKKGVIPTFLVNDGMKVTKWLYTETQPEPPAPIETPNYEDANLRRSLTNFIQAFGKKYDGDPRIGFITAGLLGTWGEWHTYPREELFASKAVQLEVLGAYEAAFQVTPVLLRYPVGDEETRARNADRKFGYHDDSFAWATLDTGRKADDWFYMAALKAAGRSAEAKWKSQPIGGEIRPEAWGEVFEKKPKNKKIQNFRQCVEATHASWLLDSGMFEKKQSLDRIRKADEEVQRLGYEFHVTAVTVGDVDEGNMTVSLAVENRGVAPFYYSWKSEWALLDGEQVIKSFPGTGDLSGLLPDEKPRVWTEKLNVSRIKPSAYSLAIRVPNPLKEGHSVRFANKTQQPAAQGWLLLDEIIIR